MDWGRWIIQVDININIHRVLRFIHLTACIFIPIKRNRKKEEAEACYLALQRTYNKEQKKLEVVVSKEGG